MKKHIKIFSLIAGAVCLILSSFIASETTEAAGEVIKLPSPEHKGRMSVEEAIYKRRSIRRYTSRPLSLSEISQVLWSAGGQTIDGITGPTRSYASAGGRYPLEIYLVAGNVTGLEPGIYKYNWVDNTLELLKKGDFRGKLSNAAYRQSMVLDAPATIVVTTAQAKAVSRYGKRGEQYVCMDAGHMGQNVHLQAESLGLGTVMIGAYSDNEVIDVLGTKGETTVYIMPIGRPR